VLVDAFAFVHAGYASVAALHDVLAGEEGPVFRHIPGHPHPVSFVRVLLGHEAALIENRRFRYAAAILTVGVLARVSLLQRLFLELDTLIQWNNP
jgi:hypothetical protein